MLNDSASITEFVMKTAEQVRKRSSGSLEPAFTGRVQWPAHCTVGPGLEGAIACESKVGYVNGSQGALIYRGYDIFDLCAYSSFEEVSYLLINGKLPSRQTLTSFKNRLSGYRQVSDTLRLLMGFPIEDMNAMAALRLATNLMRQKLTHRDMELFRPDAADAIGTDEDSIPMETMPTGEDQAVYEFRKKQAKTDKPRDKAVRESANHHSCYHLIAAVPTLAAAISRIRRGLMPVEPDPELSHAANYLYMISGKRPSPVEERIMDIALILHADHGMNASTFAAIVVASTLSDIYASIGSGIAALNGPLHGGANEQVLLTLRSIGGPQNVPAWFDRAMARKTKIMGFGHRVYKTYDPRACILGPLAEMLSDTSKDSRNLFKTANALEKKVVATLGATKNVYPNIDFYSGLVYSTLGIPTEMFTPTFAVARVSGWTARVLEYLQNNRIFRPRAIYTGPLNKPYIQLEQRGKKHHHKHDIDQVKE